MIRIIKEGKKVFTRICGKCGCEFSYELDDLTGSGIIYCPCCYNLLTHIGVPATSDVVLDPHISEIPNISNVVSK